MHNREKLKSIAKENDIILKNGYYVKNDNKISLSRFWDGNTSAVKVLAPDSFKAIFNNKDKLMMYYSVPDKHNIQIENCTSFEAAMLIKGDSTCVLNFANAVTPGGGYLNGASAQEEDLCRCSTLYQSISSNLANEMYDYNRNNPSPKDSDYMLYSKNVTVFREPQYGFYDVSFKVSVLTAPAINRNGHGSVLSDKEVDRVMIHRIRLVLKAMAYLGHSDIVLGAWGCGAFGHKAEKVAGYFKSVLIDENLIEYFENVVFAVYELDCAEPKTTAFRKIFDGYTCNDIFKTTSCLYK